MTEILVGCDPELFMFRDGRPVSAHGAIKGTKDNPFVVQNGAVQVDGTALEFNINPAHNSQEFLDNINSVMDQLKAMVPGYDVRAIPVAEYGEEYMSTLPPEAIELGCNPDFNAWADGRVNEKPNCNVPFRTASGHIHIGWSNNEDIYSKDHYDNCILAVKQLDYSLGLGSLLFDADTKRRELYGAAGAFRPKSYGVEYRVLSNAWLRSPKLMKWVYDTTIHSIQRLMDGQYFGDDQCAFDFNPVSLLQTGKFNREDLLWFLKERLGLNLEAVV